MAQTIKIKRSTSTAAPSTLANAELAYSSNSDKLYIGRPGGSTSDVDCIGGKAFTDKLDNIAANANNYSLPAATATTKGGIELFSNTVQATAGEGVTATADRTYGVQLNAGGQAVVNVPWTDSITDITGKLDAAGDTLTGTLEVNNDVKIRFGGGDLEIYHDNATTADRASYIKENGNGNLRLMGSNLALMSSDDEYYMFCQENGGVQIYADNTVVMRTMLDSSNSAKGIKIHGSLTLDHDATPDGDGLETSHIYAPEKLVIDPSSHSANTGLVVIDGNLEVKGTTTTIDSTQVTINDAYLQLNSGLGASATPVSSMICGFEVNRGAGETGSTHDAGLYWYEGSNEWKVSEGQTASHALIHANNFESVVTSLDGGTF